MADPNAVAEKVAAKAAELCAPLELEMALRKWPREFRKIMWDAVSHHAAILAAETANRSSTQQEKP
jgi:hypothetical protein